MLLLGLLCLLYVLRGFGFIGFSYKVLELNFINGGGNKSIQDKNLWILGVTPAPYANQYLILGLFSTTDR